MGVESRDGLRCTRDDTTRAAEGEPGTDEAAAARKIEWTNVLFIGAAHLLAVGAILYMALVHFSWWTLGLGLVWFALCGFAITGGYHRLFSHPTYKTTVWIRALHLFFGAASVQNSALKWSADHRIHHAHTDTVADPYNIRQGFWWAHIGWIFFKHHEPELRTVPDLAKDPLIRFQDRYYVPIATLAGAVVPFGLGLIWGDAIGALLVAGFLRIVVQWHATFAVNSLAHSVGAQPYSTSTSARDSFITALVTLGEGYHNFHHRFQSDYRNGIRWFHLDPTKWSIWGLSRLGLAWDLKRTPDRLIQRAREQTRSSAA